MQPEMLLRPRRESPCGEWRRQDSRRNASCPSRVVCCTMLYRTFVCVPLLLCCSLPDAMLKPRRLLLLQPYTLQSNQGRSSQSVLLRWMQGLSVLSCPLRRSVLPMCHWTGRRRWVLQLWRRGMFCIQAWVLCRLLFVLMHSNEPMLHLCEWMYRKAILLRPMWPLDAASESWQPHVLVHTRG